MQRKRKSNSRIEVRPPFEGNNNSRQSDIPIKPKKSGSLRSCQDVLDMNLVRLYVSEL